MKKYAIAKKNGYTFYGAFCYAGKLYEYKWDYLFLFYSVKSEIDNEHYMPIEFFSKYFEKIEEIEFIKESEFSI